MIEKEFIESLYAEKAKNDSNSQDLANSLNILSKTVFGEINRFVFELLQNADDSPIIKETSEVDVEFRLFDNYLLFKHNGLHFTDNDVKGISRVGGRESQKDKDIQKTGYKGIGFKSVFGSSECVHIISNNFTFRFDKDFEKWKDRIDYPWQVIPIWTEDPPSEIKDYIDTNAVNTIISISNKEKIKEEILNIFKDCQIILFLRHVKSVTFYNDDERLFSIKKNETDNGIRELIKDGVVQSSWIMKDFLITVDDGLKQKLRLLSDEECPPKLKQAEVVKITLAAFIKENKVIPISDALLYSYLPTKVKKDFPYIINADFITNAERTQFLINDWNSFLFEKIAIKQFEWINELQLSTLKHQFTKLIKKKFTGYYMTDLDRSFNSGFEIAIQTIPFIPVEKEKGLLKISEAIVDSTSFSSVFGTEQILIFLQTEKKIADINIDYSSILVDIGCEEFEINNLSQLFNDNKFSVRQENLLPEITKVIQFFKDKTSKNKNTDWLPILKQTKFLIDQNKQFEAPREIYFPLANEEFDFIEIQLLESSIYNAVDEETHTWLQELGVKEPSSLEIVRKSIKKLIDEDNINESNVIQVGKFIFQVYKEGKLSDTDYKELSHLKILTRQGLFLPNDCYFSNEFDPILKIEHVLPEANFVSNLYCDDTSNYIEWKTFLKRLGVKEKISIRVNTHSEERNKLISKNSNFSAYLEWLDNNDYYPSIYKGYRHSGQHGVTNFASIDFIEQTNSYSFSKEFWKIILNNWTDFFAKCFCITYYYRGGSTLVPSYIRYYVQNHLSIPATDGNCYPGIEVYSPTLKTLIGDHFPVADIDTKLNREQIEFFGLKIRITFLHCFEILKSLESKPVDSTLNKQIFAVYDQMVKSKQDLTKQDIIDIQTWRKTGKLLALNNTFQEVDSLFCFSVNGYTAPANSEYFVKLPLDIKSQDIETFCSLFEIPFVSYDKLEFVAKNSIEENELPLKLISKAKYFAIIFAHLNSSDVNLVFKQLIEKIESTSFYHAESLSLIYKIPEENTLIFNLQIDTWFNQENSFYYVGKWNSPLTLYSLSSSLCHFMGLKNMERELVLVLQLNEQEIITWLTEKGYEIPFWEDAIDQVGLNTFSEVYSDFEYEESSDSDENFTQIHTLSTQEFIPEIKASDVDISKVKTARKTAESISLYSEIKEINSIENEKVRVDIGRWSEEFVHNYFKSKPDIYENVIWHNEHGESYGSCDFEVIENGIQKFIEVKGTPSSSKEIIYISVNEWKLMFKKGPQYSIYRLLNAGQADACLDIIDDPADLIKLGVILPNPICLQV